MQETCHVCGLALDDEDLACCLKCNRNFHFAWSVNSPTKNCGHFWVDGDSCTLRFVCNTCFGQETAFGHSPSD